MSVKFENYSEVIRKCAFCKNMCVAYCPLTIVTGKQTYSPWKRSMLMYLALSGRVDRCSEDMVDLAYKCETCQLCKENCIFDDVDIPAIVEALRSELVSQGWAPESIKFLAEDLKNKYSPESTEYKAAYASLANLTPLKEQAEVVYFLGHNTLFETPEIAKAVAKILTRAGVDFSLLPAGEYPAGKWLSSLGLTQLMQEFTRLNAEKINKIGCKTLVANDPSVVETFKVDAVEWGIELKCEVLHITEFITRCITEGKLKPSKTYIKSVAYHDSTHLGRRLGCYDAPRDLLSQIPGLYYKELWRNHGLSRPAGTGTNVVFPELAADIAAELITEIKKAGVDILAVSSPREKQFLKTLIDKPTVMDVTEILAEAI